ncbi:MAG: 2'-5' RNA ligase family protein, partial [Rhodoferax sp.]
MLFTVAMPDWAPEIDARVQACRRGNDPQYALIGPHFTLTFGVPVEEAACIEHVDAIAREASPIRFVLRRAQVQSSGPGLAHVFLVPDEGAGALVALHDRLYRGLLAPWLSQDEAFLPHVTVAAFDNPQSAQL